MGLTTGSLNSHTWHWPGDTFPDAQAGSTHTHAQQPNLNHLLLKTNLLKTQQSDPNFIPNSKLNLKTQNKLYLNGDREYVPIKKKVLTIYNHTTHKHTNTYASVMIHYWVFAWPGQHVLLRDMD